MQDVAASDSSPFHHKEVFCTFRIMKETKKTPIVLFILLHGINLCRSVQGTVFAVQNVQRKV